MPGLAIGVDVGGSQIKLVAIDADGIIHHREIMPLNRKDGSPQAILDGIIAEAQAFRSGLIAQCASVDGIGFAFPCYLVGQDWALGNVTNIPALEGYPVRPALVSAFGEAVSGVLRHQRRWLGRVLVGSWGWLHAGLFYGGWHGDLSQLLYPPSLAGWRIR